MAVKIKANFAKKETEAGKKPSKPKAVKKQKKSSALLKKATMKGHKGFLPGKSGNPNGRPPGSRNKSTLAIEAMLEGQGPQLAQQCIKLALEGNTVALRLAMERILPPKKSRVVSVDLPQTKSIEDVQKAQDVVMQFAADGSITLDEANQFFVLLEAKRKVIETFDLAERIEKIEVHLETEK
jgi:hypothetical protein